MKRLLKGLGVAILIVPPLFLLFAFLYRLTENTFFGGGAMLLYLASIYGFFVGILLLIVNLISKNKIIYKFHYYFIIIYGITVLLLSLNLFSD